MRKKAVRTISLLIKNEQVLEEVDGVQSMKKPLHLKLSHMFHAITLLMSLKFGFVSIASFYYSIGRHRIDDLQRRIAVSDFESNDPDIRSPSPEPVYDPKTGLRMNTRD